MCGLFFNNRKEIFIPGVDKGKRGASGSLPGIDALNSFSAKGNIEVSADNADSGESARNELSHLKSALFAF